MSLEQPRLRILIADDVGLGKTLEAGQIAAKQILCSSTRRILVISTREVLNQLKKKFWTRFSISLAAPTSPTLAR
jgi:SNF2 family DNA or RNA helicase